MNPSEFVNKKTRSKMNMKVTYRKTGNPEIPSIIRRGDYETPVWIQRYWKTGPDVQYIRNNGCGHCCTAMAAGLNGVKMDPEQEYALCVKLWGQPSGVQDHFQTVGGICHILSALGIPAVPMGIPADKEEKRILRERLEEALKSDKQIILWSHVEEGREDENPFAPGEHYVLACGFDAGGRIVIANSADGMTEAGVQTVTLDTIMDALYEGAVPEIETWGEDDRLDKCGGLVIVG